MTTERSDSPPAHVQDLQAELQSLRLANAALEARLNAALLARHDEHKLSQHHIKRLMDSAASLLFVLDADGQLTQIRQAAKHLLGSILDFSKIEAGKMGLEAMDLSLETLPADTHPRSVADVLAKPIRHEPAGLPPQQADSAPVPALAGVPAPPLSELALLQSWNGVVGLDVAAGLPRMGGKPATFIRFLRKLVQAEGDCTARVRAALAAGDAEQARRHAHSAKGGAANLSVKVLAHAAAKIEQLLIEGEPEPAALERAMQQFEQCLRVLDKTVSEA